LKDIYLTREKLQEMIEVEGTEILSEMHALGLEDILQSKCDLIIN